MSKNDRMAGPMPLVLPALVRYCGGPDLLGLLATVVRGLARFAMICWRTRFDLRCAAVAGALAIRDLRRLRAMVALRPPLPPPALCVTAIVVWIPFAKEGARPLTLSVVEALPQAPPDSYHIGPRWCALCFPSFQALCYPRPRAPVQSARRQYHVHPTLARQPDFVPGVGSPL